MTEVNTRMEFAGPEGRPKRYRMSPDFVLREIAGEYAIIPLGEGTVFSNTMMTPNRTAAFLWKSFSEPSTEEDVVRRVMEQFDGDEAAIRRDVKRFVTDTLKNKVLMEVD